MAKLQRAHVEPALLVWARKSIRLSVEEAARKLGVDTDRLATWETGEAQPTINQLRKAGNVYKRPLAVFFLSEPPADFSVPHDFRRLPDEEPLELSPEFVLALRQAHYRRRLAMELDEGGPRFPDHLVGSVAISSDVMAVAGQIRTLLDVPLADQAAWRDAWEALNAWKNAIETTGVLVFHFSGVEVEEARAFSLCEPDYPVIALNGKDAATARVFSLVHEFTHLLLGRGGCCDLREQGPSTSSNRRAEVFCNYVAGEVLVPQAVLRSHPLVASAADGYPWTDEELLGLAREFSVSPEVILRRLVIAGKASHALYDSRRSDWLAARVPREAQASGGFLPFPRRVVRELGKPFLRIVLSAYYREAITASDLSEYLGARLKHLRAIEGLLYGRNVLTGGDR